MNPLLFCLWIGPFFKEEVGGFTKPRELPEDWPTTVSVLLEQTPFEILVEPSLQSATPSFNSTLTSCLALSKAAAEIVMEDPLAVLKPTKVQVSVGMAFVITGTGSLRSSASFPGVLLAGPGSSRDRLHGDLLTAVLNVGSN